MYQHDWSTDNIPYCQHEDLMPIYLDLVKHFTATSITVSRLMQGIKATLHINIIIYR